MGEATNIEWCDTTTNPVMGCRGCELWVPEKNIRRCYAGKLHENGKGRKPGHAALFLIPEAFPAHVSPEFVLAAVRQARARGLIDKEDVKAIRARRRVA